jgi:NAD(P)-dependent dehydrogenase (short-subunit alcohol dehydrogenase family)
MSRDKDLFALTGEVIVITGGAGFLGLMHAEAILSAGGIPVLLDINQPALDATLKDLQSKWSDRAILGMKVDITNEREVENACATITERFERIDALINNAANNPSVSANGTLSSSTNFERLSLVDWRNDLEVGLTGAFLCAQKFGALMAKRGKGVIVNISSDLGIISPDQRLYRRPELADDAQPNKSVTYSVVKSGIIGLTRYLATYWATRNVRVNTLSLGGVMNDQAETFLQRVHELIPLGRLANRDEYKGCIVFLCSRASSYMTGANLVVDGGRTIW